MSVVVIYNELINEILNFINEYTHAYTNIHIRRLINLASEKFIAHITLRYVK